MSLFTSFSKRMVRLTPGLSSFLGRAHARAVRASGGRLTPRFLGMPLLTLVTVGRRTGKRRETPMIFMRDGEDYVVVASNGGADRTPAWYLNALAAGTARINVRGTGSDVTVREATPDERERLWPQLDAQYDGYAEYREVAARSIPILKLTPR